MNTFEEIPQEDEEFVWKRATSTECAIPFTPLADMPDNEEEN